MVGGVRGSGGLGTVYPSHGKSCGCTPRACSESDFAIIIHPDCGNSLCLIFIFNPSITYMQWGSQILGMQLNTLVHM